jgi:rubredoxin
MTHECIVCGFIYDDTQETQPFTNLSPDWTCPDCMVGKDCFVPASANKRPEGQ